jgi:LysM repeat protein
MRWSLRLMLAAACMLAAGACSHLPELPQMPRLGEQATPGLSPRERVRLAVELLGDGEEPRAERELRAALDEQPNNSAARRLLQQITDDPRTLLGVSSRSYTVRQGETMSALAERFLGDPLLFYALARYNNLSAPNQLAAGQRLMIPHRPGAPVSASAPPASASTPGAAPSQPIDAAQANQLRLQGLQQLNAGNVEAAVRLLRQAVALDAGNAAFQRDLDRALRLQARLNTGGGGG